MLELLSPDLIFNKQKVFVVHEGDDKTPAAITPRKVIVVFDAPTEHLLQPVKEMLDKLIQACQFKPEDTIYLNARFTPDVSLGNLQNSYTPTAVLVFGDVSLSRNLSKLKKNFAYDLSGVKVLNAEPLDLLVKNDAAKKALWGELKRMLKL